MDINVRTWATAISTHAGNGRKIFWRFAQEFRPEFDPARSPDRIIVVWRYDSDTGQPLHDEHQQMNKFEDLLEPVTAGGRLATLALVSTGECLREWTYYARSADAFLEGLNAALRDEPRFPVEINVEHDPSWSMYAEFLAGVKPKVLQRDS